MEPGLRFRPHLLALVVFLAASALALSLVQGQEPPALPTFIYGKLISSDMAPLGGVKVEAMWIEVTGIQHSTSTMTLTQKEAAEMNNSGLAGYYLFKEGTILAKVGSEIILLIGKGSVTLDAAPGGAAVQMRTLMLGSDGELIEGLIAGDTARKEPEARQPSPSPGAAPGQQQDDFPILPSLERMSLSQVLLRPEAAGAQNESGEPLVIFGLVQSIEGMPLPSENVTVEWTEPNGTIRKMNLLTLSKAEEEKAADPQKEEEREGTFTLAVEPSDVKDGTAVTVSTAEGTVLLLSEPGSDIPLWDIDLSSSIREQETVPGPEEEDRQFFLGLGGSTAGKVALGALLACLAILSLAISLRRRRRGPWETPVSPSKEKIPLISAEDSAGNAVQRFITEDIDAFVVMKGRDAVGMLTMEDILGKLALCAADPDAVAVKQLMSKLKPLRKGATLLEAISFSLDEDAPVLPVMRGRSLMGVMTRRDILGSLRAIFSAKGEGVAVPSVGSIMGTAAVRAEKDTTLVEAVVAMLDKGAEGIVLGEGEGVRLITPRAVLEELFDNPARVKKTTLGQLLREEKRFSLSPEMDLLRASQLMDECGAERCAVLAHGEFAGIVTRKGLLRGFMALVKEHGDPGKEKDAAA